MYSDRNYPLTTANYFAKMSCAKWNSPKFKPRTKLGKFFAKKTIDKIYEASRRHYREKLWIMALNFWESNERQFWVKRLKNEGCFSTYPWPYCVLKFADWNNGEEGTTVYDPSGCIVKDSTSYCAWKIFECTGQWPNKGKNLRTTAKYWQWFLAQAGYTEIVEKPEFDHHYVGIEPRDGKNGMAVWFEKPTMSGNLVVSCYRDDRYNEETIKSARVPYYIWIKID